MYRPKKHVRLTAIPHAPKAGDVKSLLEEAKKAKGCTVELPWKNKLTGVHYSLTTRLEVAGGGEPIWTLYEGEGGTSRVVWSSPFEDVDLLYDVLMLSIPEEVETEFSGKAAGASGRASSSASSLPPDYSSSYQPPLYNDSGDSGLLTGNEKVELPQSSMSFYQSGFASENEFALLSDTAKESEFPKPSPKEEKKEEKKAEAAPTDAVQASGAYPMQPGAQPGAPGMPQGMQYPPGYPYPAGYQYPQGAYPQGYPQGYYPGYPGYPPQYGYPPGYVPPAGTVALQGQQANQQGMMDSGVHAPPADPAKPRPNVRLGQFLVEAGLVPETTIDAALQLQELVRSGSLPTAKAAEAVRRAHIRGGAVDPKLIAAPVTPNDMKAVAPPLGQILVEAAIIRGPVIRMALKLQESIRNASMTKDDALDALCLEVFGVGRKVQDTTGETTESTQAMELLKKAQLVSDFDHETASKVRDKHGGQLVGILVKAGKLDQHTADGAFKCNKLVEEKKIEEGKAIIALHYCQRSRIDLDSALKELGWESSI